VVKSITIALSLREIVFRNACKLQSVTRVAAPPYWVFLFALYAVPQGCIVGYYPECNGLIPLGHCAKESKVPAAKSVPVRIERQHEFP
jgi:hypothetical protein